MNGLSRASSVKSISRAYQSTRNVSSATAGITKVHRLMYCRMYPTMVVQPDGSTMNIRYSEPRNIIRLPLDLTTLTEEERKQRMENRKPKIVLKIEEDLEDSFSAKKYLRYIKK